VALDASRHWLRARLEERPVTMTASLCPDERFESLEARWIDLARDRPRMTLVSALAGFLPASVAAAILDALSIAPDQTMAELTRETRRTLTHALLAWPLPVTDSRGYSYAEVTAGGVTLTEIDPATMASRVCEGLYLVGEILDVDGRIGGFNFQWAWATAAAAGAAAAKLK
jgi:predicted Rossmann fold flavoprotein